MMFSMYAQENQKAIFLAPQDPKKPTVDFTFCENLGLIRMPRQSSPKMSTPPASGEPPSFIGLRLTPQRGGLILLRFKDLLYSLNYQNQTNTQR
jgi:hypothetical protein